MQTLAQKVLHHIRRLGLLKAGDRVGAAVSGGADSVALLRLLLELRRELGIVLSVVHFNHKLRGAEAEADERFVARLAGKHGLELHSGSGEVAAFASEKRLSLEAAARDLRYAYFLGLLHAGKLNRMATAHSLDDQAETVLLRLVRGAGTRGLAGVYPVVTVGDGGIATPEEQPTLNPKEMENQFPVSGSQFTVRSQPAASIVRPLLGIQRRELEYYLTALGQEWQEDKSNRDLRHARNRVRHGILPRLERSLNPAVREALAETAEIARAEEEYWEREAGRVLPQVWGKHESELDLRALSRLSLALQRRVVRAAAERLGLRLEFRHVEEVLEMSHHEGAGETALPGGWIAVQNRGQLRWQRQYREDRATYEYGLIVPGRVEVLETGTAFEAVRVAGEGMAGYNRDQLLDIDVLGKELRVRNWRAGDRYWPAHTKAPKKIKELLQERKVSGFERALWPVVVMGEEIVWMRGFPAPAQWRARSREAVLIREVTISG